MLTRLILIGVVLVVGVGLYFAVSAIMRRGQNPRQRNAPPRDVVDRGAPNDAMSDESVDERIARLEEELRRLDEEGDEPPGKGTA